MKKLILFALYSIIAYFPASLLAQEVPCIYRLELSDAMGDGWNGARLEIDVNSQTTEYGILDGSSARFYLPFSDGDQVSIRFFGGDKDEEVSFGLFSETEDPILEASGLLPLGGSPFNASISCATCPVPPISSVEVADLLAVSASINWIAPDTMGSYLVEFGADGINPGEGDSTVYQGNTSGQLTLSEKTAYTFYISSICANGDTSQAIGPFNFETCYANDVGAFAITGPETDCNLETSDSVKTTLINYGANPQSLIPFAYSVNQEPVNIDMPRDGIYTGVLGKDSLGYPVFDATYDFSAPGEYYIEVWTEYEEDSDLSNDTISTTIYSLATISELPYREDFEGDFASWIVGEDSEASSWALGAPTGGVINSAASGSNIWATNLNGSSNAGELSYLLSPCMDLSGVFTDPIIAFQLWESTETDVDQFWLESSIDGGETWTRVEEISYNGDFFSFSGDNSNTDWVRQFGYLDGLAGQRDVRLRFAYFSDFATQQEGVGIDDIIIFEQNEVDLMLNTIATSGDLACLAEDQETIDLVVTNLGSAAITGFNLFYSIDGGSTLSTTIEDINLDTASSTTISLDLPIDALGTSSIVAWVSLPNDENGLNDTTRVDITATYTAPFSQDFESGTYPRDWIATNSFPIVTNGHGNSSYVVSQNLRLQSPILTLTTPSIGLVNSGDTLTFDYRYVEFSDNSGKNLNQGDRLQVFVAEGCSNQFELFTTIDQSNHTTSADFTQVAIPLDSFAGQVIKVRLVATWGGGNYWVDLDNFQIPRCDLDLLLETVFTDQLDGSIEVAVTPLEGIGPYAYTWSTGDSGSSITRPNENYGVTVTDNLGCQGFFEEQVVVSTTNFAEIGQIELFPNPTQDWTRLAITLSEASDLNIQVLNAIGQPIFEQSDRQITKASYDLDLKQAAPGIYFVRINAEGRTTTRKLLKTR